RSSDLGMGRPREPIEKGPRQVRLRAVVRDGLVIELPKRLEILRWKLGGLAHRQGKAVGLRAQALLTHLLARRIAQRSREVIEVAVQAGVLKVVLIAEAICEAGFSQHVALLLRAEEHVQGRGVERLGELARGFDQRPRERRWGMGRMRQKTLSCD